MGKIIEQRRLGSFEASVGRAIDGRPAVESEIVTDSPSSRCLAPTVSLGVVAYRGRKAIIPVMKSPNVAAVAVNVAATEPDKV